MLGEETTSHRQFIFSELNPRRGRSRELVRVDREDTTAEYDWALSPDGNTIAFAKQFDPRIRLVSLNHESLRDIRVAGWNHLRNITWAADGRGFFASSPSKVGGVLLHIDLHGSARVLWELAGQNVYLRAIPSPDGHRLAILGSLVDDNVWMMENF